MEVRKRTVNVGNMIANGKELDEVMYMRTVDSVCAKDQVKALKLTFLNIGVGLTRFVLNFNI